jgi:hypothetical protein
VVTRIESDHGRDRVTPGTLDQAIGVVEIKAERLLDEHVLVRVGRRQGDGGVRDGRHARDDGIDRDVLS